MKILSIDPGITTGYAVIDDGVLVESGNLLFEDFDGSILTKYVSRNDVEVVIELTPTYRMGYIDTQIQQVKGWLTVKFPKAIKILPGLWKGNKSIVNLPFPQEESRDIPITAHQRDAYRLGMFYMIYMSQREKK